MENTWQSFVDRNSWIMGTSDPQTPREELAELGEKYPRLRERYPEIYGGGSDDITGTG